VEDVDLPVRVRRATQRPRDQLRRVERRWRSGAASAIVGGNPSYTRKESVMAEYRLQYAAPLRPLLSVLGMGPGLSGVDVTGDELRVQMGWAFHSRIPLGSVRHAEPSVHPIWGGWGVHGWNGRWLVNGSSHGMVRLDIDPAGKALVCGVPARLRTLYIGLEDPDGLLARLHHAKTAP
jgi:hypothetical protein